MNTRQIVPFIVLFLGFLGCSKNTNEQLPVEENIELIVSDFHFTLKENSSLDKDYTGIKSSNTFEFSIPESTQKKLIANYKTTAKKVLVNNVEQVSGFTSNDFSGPVAYSFIGSSGEIQNVTVKVNWEKTVSADIPHITINTENSQEITSKDTYLKSTINIDGKGLYSNLSTTSEIRGRGNSTWSQPKKPYRIRLTQKSEVLGLPAARNWVLLANYLDPSLMVNAVAMRIGRDLAVPFTNTIIPVDLTVNGEYRGSYVLTEHLEVAEKRINIGDDGYLFELDTYYDEEFQFKSAGYNLPVMIKEPELKLENEITPIKEEFEVIESLIKSSSFPNNGYRDLLDVDVFAKYLLVYFLTGNEELNHPKSTYMHKKQGGKFSFGPIWDFDWAYGFEGGGGHYSAPQRNYFWTTPQLGTTFFTRLLQDPITKTAFKNHWTKYKSEHLNNLMIYIDEYSTLIKASKGRDDVKWKRGKNFDTEVIKLKKYISDRAIYLDNYTKGF